MLNKWNFEVARFASKDTSRYTFNAILVTDKATIATNGEYLMWVSTPPEMKANDFPAIDHAPAAQDTWKPFLLATDDAVKIAKAIPKKSTIPILSTAAVAVKDDQPIIMATDLQCPQVFRPRVPTGTFPNTDAVMPKKAPVVRVCVDAIKLERIAKFAAEFAKGRVEAPLYMSIYGDGEAIRFDMGNDNTNQGATALLMPMRGSEDVKYSYGWNEREAKREAERKASEEKDAEEAVADAEADGPQEETAETVAAVDEVAEVSQTDENDA